MAMVVGSAVLRTAMAMAVPSLVKLLQYEWGLDKTVKDGLTNLEAELGSMQAFLEDVSTMPPDQQIARQLKVWADQVRELCYAIENRLHSYMARIESAKGTLLSAPIKVKINHEMDKYIKETKIKVKRIRERYGPYPLKSSLESTSTREVDPRMFVMYTRESNPVGITGAINELTKKLSKGDHVSIVGLGGIGKTTLAQAVYDKMKSEFACSAFVPIGQRADMKKVLAYTCDELRIDTHGHESNHSRITNQLQKFLEDKRCLIVLDDIWEERTWNFVERVFKGSAGSKIITTTRNHKVAEEVGGVYEIKPLSPDNSKKLLRTKAQAKNNDTEFDILSDKLLRKCGGIPIAITVIGSLLAKNQSKEWNRVYDSIGFDEHKEDGAFEHIRRVFSYSYTALPYNIQKCFLYLNLFPEDHWIEKNMLIWRWIAEGLVPDFHEQTPGSFEIGEAYFNELLDRSMVQWAVSPRDLGDGQGGCRVHSLMLDLIRDQSSSENENFSAVLGRKQESTSQARPIHRLAIHKTNVGQIQNTSLEVGEVLSLYANTCPAGSAFPPLSRFAALRVVDLEDCDLSGGDCKLKDLGKLGYLKYIGLLGTPLAELPKNIGGLKFLQTLDVTATSIKELPSFVEKLRRLRCLRASKGTRMMGRVGKLTSLEELWLHSADKSPDFAAELKKLTELRVLVIHFDKMDEGVKEVLVGSLSSMKKLQILQVWSDEEEMIHLGGWEGTIPSPHLRQLLLFRISLPSLASWVHRSYVPKLSKLLLHVETLEAQHLAILGQMSSLLSLYLHSVEYKHLSYTADKDEFKVLEYLNTNIELVCGDGALPAMKELEVGGIRVGTDVGLQGSMPLLERASYHIDCFGCNLAEVEKAEEALRQAIQAHPNHPTLCIKRFNNYDIELKEQHRFIESVAPEFMRALMTHAFSDADGIPGLGGGGEAQANAFVNVAESIARFRSAVGKPPILTMGDAADGTGSPCERDTQFLPVSASLGVMGSLELKLDVLLDNEHKNEIGKLTSRMLGLSKAHDLRPVAKIWMKDMRELSYEIENCVNAVDADFIDEMSRVKARLKEANGRYDRYNLKSAHSHCSDIFPIIDQSVDSGQKKPDPVVVGLHNDGGAVHELCQWLTNDDGKKDLKVRSILGVGGIGKTTLAKQLWRENKLGHFSCRAFVRTAKKPDMRRILRSILAQVRPHQPADACEVHDLIHDIRHHLQDKRYFLIIDDLWATSVWDVASRAFPEGIGGSRIITTTEIEDVALACCSHESNYIFKMEPLSLSFSKELFTSAVFGAGEQHFHPLDGVSNEIVRRCAGLPQAIISISSVLASQGESYTLKNREIMQNNLPTNATYDNVLKQVLKFCFNCLPSCLQTCLLYLSLYPENYIILKEDIVKQWVTEGFIRVTTEKEDSMKVAGSYFDTLVNMGLIQHVNVNYTDELLYYVVQHTVHGLITSKSIEENFVTLIDYSQRAVRFSHKVSRLSLQFGSATYATMPTSTGLSQVRSLAFFGLTRCLPSISEFKLLRFLILHIWTGQPSTGFHLWFINKLALLRSLQVICNDNVHLPDLEDGPEHLETLEINATVVSTLSNIFHLRRWLHLRLGAGTELHDVTGNQKNVTLNTPISLDESISPRDSVMTIQLFQSICRIPKWIGQLSQLSILKVVLRELQMDDISNLGGLPLLTVLSLHVQQRTSTEEISFLTGAFTVLYNLEFRCYGALRLIFKIGTMPNLHMLKLGFNAQRGEQNDCSLFGIEHLLTLQEISGIIGSSTGTEEPHWRAAESAFQDAVCKHPCYPSKVSIMRTYMPEEEYDPQGKQHSILLKQPSNEQLQVLLRPKESWQNDTIKLEGKWENKPGGSGMADNCFGEEVDDYKLDQMVRYKGKPKTQRDRAVEALNLMNEDDKDVNAFRFVKELKSVYGNGQSTLCVVYNASGDTLHKVDNHDWYGYVGSTPYPAEIGNGQWAAFHHVHRVAEPSGSVGAVVYRGKNGDGEYKDFLVAWSTPWSLWHRNKAYCEIGDVNRFQTLWDSMYDVVANSDHSSKARSVGCEMEASIETGHSPKFTARIICR